MSRIILDYSSWLLPLCLLMGVAYAALLYSGKPLWSKEINFGLFLLRALPVSALGFFFLITKKKLSTHAEEAHSLVIFVDKSKSVGKSKEAKDKKWSDHFWQTKEKLEKLGYEVHVRDLENKEVKKLDWKGKTSDLAGALKEVTS